MTVSEFLKSNNVIVIDGEYTDETIAQAYEAGYSEALRWRDPINDPPKCNDLMQIKYGDIFSNTIDYGHDRYLEDMGMWDIEQLANIKVLAWRPIR